MNLNDSFGRTILVRHFADKYGALSIRSNRFRHNYLPPRTGFLSLIFLCALVISGLPCVASFAQTIYGLPLQNENSSPPNVVEKQALDYRVWRVFSQDTKGFTVIVVSVDPKHFNRSDMMKLAVELNKRFPDKSKLKVGLLDDENIARLFAEGRAEYSTYETAERGRYYLDRRACKAYIQFSTQRGRPRQTLNLDCE